MSLAASPGQAGQDTGLKPWRASASVGNIQPVGPKVWFRTKSLLCDASIGRFFFHWNRQSIKAWFFKAKQVAHSTCDSITQGLSLGVQFKNWMLPFLRLKISRVTGSELSSKQTSAVIKGSAPTTSGSFLIVLCSVSLHFCPRVPHFFHEQMEGVLILFSW